MTTNEQLHLGDLITMQRMVKAQQEEILKLREIVVDQGRRSLWLAIHNDLCMQHLGVDQDLRQEIKAKAHAETERLEAIENLRMDYESDSFERQEGAES